MWRKREGHLAGILNIMGQGGSGGWSKGLRTVFQRSKLTFSKSRLLATLNCKMVATKNIRLPREHFMTYYTEG